MTLTTLPNPNDATAAKGLLKHLTGVSDKQQVQIIIDGTSFDLPPSVQELLLEIIENIAEEKAISLIPINRELTTQQAANFLNVSRPFLIGLLDQGKIKYKKVGTHRRVVFEDLMKYKKLSYTKSMEILDELIRESQELNLGY